jgi:hypothetical protein
MRVSAPGYSFHEQFSGQMGSNGSPGYFLSQAFGGKAALPSAQAAGKFLEPAFVAQVSSQV